MDKQHQPRLPAPAMPAEQPMPAQKEVASLKAAASQAGAPAAISEQATGIAPHGGKEIKIRGTNAAGIKCGIG